MNNQIEWQALKSESRARVYLLWAILVTFGFVATHLYQRQAVVGLWALISVVGLGYMYRVMPLRVTQMKKIFTAWLVPITFGMAVSGLVFYVDTPLTNNILAHLGAFWLLVMAVGYGWNGAVDPPSTWYWFAVVINIAAGTLCFSLYAFGAGQYLIAAVVSAWSLLYLWLFRSVAS